MLVSMEKVGMILFVMFVVDAMQEVQGWVFFAPLFALNGYDS